MLTASPPLLCTVSVGCCWLLLLAAGRCEYIYMKTLLLIVGTSARLRPAANHGRGSTILLAASPEPPDWTAESDRESWMGPATMRPLDSSSFVVAPAGDKGQGLFCTRDIEKGTYLFAYGGRTLTFAEYEGGSDYAAGIQNAAGAQFVIDASDADDPQSGLGRYMNHDSSDDGANCECIRGAYAFADREDIDALPPRLHLFTSRDVRAGEELCWDYGPAFWHGREENKQRLEELEWLEALAEAQQAEQARAAGIASLSADSTSSSRARAGNAKLRNEDAGGGEE